MAGSKISDYSNADNNIQNMQLTLDANYRGYHGFSLTNYDSTSESAIAAGSRVECNGALYGFNSDESITDPGVSDGTVYIQLVPDGDDITAQYTNTVPEWSDSKQGYYDPTAGNENYRYLEFIIYLESGSWNKQRRITAQNDSFLPKTSSKIYINNSTTLSGTNNTIIPLILDTVNYDTNNEYSVSTGYFTMKNKGSFLFSGTFRGTVSSSTLETVTIILNKNDSTYITVYGHPFRVDAISSSGQWGADFCFPIELDLGDTLSLNIYFGSSATTYNMIDNEVFLYQII